MLKLNFDKMYSQESFISRLVKGLRFYPPCQLLCESSSVHGYLGNCRVTAEAISVTEKQWLDYQHTVLDTLPRTSMERLDGPHKGPTPSELWTSWKLRVKGFGTSSQHWSKKQMSQCALTWKVSSYVVVKLLVALTY